MFADWLNDAGTLTPEVHPQLQVSTCTVGGACTAATKPIVIDSNWRFLHNVGGSTNVGLFFHEVNTFSHIKPSAILATLGTPHSGKFHNIGRCGVIPVGANILHHFRQP